MRDDASARAVPRRDGEHLHGDAGRHELGRHDAVGRDGTVFPCSSVNV
jgi:hypothetical protein